MELSQGSVKASNQTHPDLQEENVLLKDQVIRLNKELSIYQQNLGILPTSPNRSHHEIEIPKSISDSKVLKPLLTAYDHRIEELSTFIERQGSVLDTITQQSNDLLSENENLRARIIEGLPRKANDKIQECKVNMKHEVGVKQLLSDKHLLEEQTELLVKEVHHANETIASRDTNISLLREQIQNKLILIQKQHDKAQQLQKEKKICEKELLSLIKTSSTQKNQIEKLNTCIRQLKEKETNTLSKIESIEMEKHYLEVENETFTTKLTQAASLIHELRQQVSSGTSDFMDLNEKYLTAKKDSENKQTKIGKMLQSHTELKFQFDIVNEKEKELRQAHQVLKSEVKELELSRDRAKATSTLLEKEVNRILLHSKGDEDAKNSSYLSRWKNDTCEEIKRRDNLIHALKLKNTGLAIRSEKNCRQTDVSETMHQTLERCIQKERNTTKSELETLQRELSDLTTKFKTEHSQKIELLNEKRALQQEVTISRESMMANENELQRLHDDQKRKTVDFAQTRKRLQSKIEELNKSLEREKNNLLEEKESLVLERDEIKFQKEANFDSIQCKNHQLELSLKDSMKSNKLLRDEIQLITEKNMNRVKELEKQHKEKMAEYQESLDEHVRKNEELLSGLQGATGKIFNLDVSLNKRDNDIYYCNRKLMIAEEKISLLTTQLHDSLSDQSSKLSHIKNLKMELRKLKMKEITER